MPGFITLWGAARFSVSLQEWLGAAPDTAPTLAGFLFGTLAAIAAGLIVNAVRWHLVDPLHYASGVPRRNWNYSQLPDQVEAFRYLVSAQFRYYECYAKLHQRCQFRQVDQLVNFLERLPGRSEACFEASCSYGWCYELLQLLASRVVVAHPGLLRLIFRSKQKNDRADAEKLAKLLYLGEVPTVHVPTANVWAWRELITFRRKLIEKRTKPEATGTRC